MANDPFIDQLTGLCRSEPTRPKWVIVPAHALGLTLGGRLAREGTNWANLRCVTPLDLAVRMAAPFLLERGIDPSEEGLGPALVMRLLLRLPEQGGYFRPMAAQPSMAEALWRTMRELRGAGLRASDLRAEAFVSAAKHAELVAALHRIQLGVIPLGDGARAFRQRRKRRGQALGQQEGQHHGGKEREQQGERQREPEDPAQRRA